MKKFAQSLLTLSLLSGCSDAFPEGQNFAQADASVNLDGDTPQAKIKTHVIKS